MHGGVLVSARPLHKVLSLGYVWLFLNVCACCGNTGLVRRGGLWVSGHLTPTPGVNALTFPRTPGGSRGDVMRSGPLQGCRAPLTCLGAGGGESSILLSLHTLHRVSG